MTDLNKIVEDLSKLTVVEAAELSKTLEEKWGVTAAAPVAVAAAGAAGAVDEDADDTEDGAADGADDATGEEEVDDAGTPVDAVEGTDKPAGSVSVTATMGAVVALLVASAF